MLDGFSWMILARWYYLDGISSFGSHHVADQVNSLSKLDRRLRVTVYRKLILTHWCISVNEKPTFLGFSNAKLY